PHQVVRDAELTLQEEDLSHLPEGERERALEAFNARESNRPFDLRFAPPIRFTLIRVSENEHFLYYVTNHVVFDGFSHDLLLRDLKALYEARLEGREAPQAPGYRFTEYLRWHADFLA